MKTVDIQLTSFDAVIFDMDGTMIDNHAAHREAWMAFVEKHQLSVTAEDFNQHYAGKKNSEILSGIFERSLSPVDTTKYAEEKEAFYRKIYEPDLAEIKGLKEVLSAIKEHSRPLAIATTSPRSNWEFILKKLDLVDTFDCVKGDEDVQKGKPNPEIYLLAAAALEVQPSRCLVFEDTPSGVEAAKSAGMQVVAILKRYTKNNLCQADHFISDYTQISFT